MFLSNIYENRPITVEFIIQVVAPRLRSVVAERSRGKSEVNQALYLAF
jgi:hypothetical protein